MCMFNTPKMPDIPPVTPVPAPVDSSQSRQVGDQTRRRLRAAAGASSNIATAPLGIMSQANVTRASALGANV